MNFPSFATFAEPKKTDGEHSKKRGEERKEKDRSHSETSKHVNENESKDIKDKKRKRESRDKERKKKNRKSRKNEDDIQDQLRKELALPDENKLFVVDRRGDLKNVVYDSLTSASVPMYRRGTNKILGMEGYILSNAANQKFAEGGLKMMELNGPYIADSPRSKYLEWKRTLRQKPTNIKDIAQRPERNKPNRSTLTGKKEDQAEYIQLESESDSEIGEPGLYKIDDNAKNPAATSVDEEYFKRTKEVNIKLDKDQNNVQLWMEYIAIQDLLLPKSKRLQKNRAAQSIAVESKKLGIYEKALKQIPNDETLLIGYIESYGVVHGSANILNKWAYVLRSKQKSISLWSRYLNFRQTEVGSFTVSGCVEAYSKCITALAPWKESPDDTVQIFEEHMLHMFNRCCTLLEQTGYNERAVSLYQAMIELTCFCPAAYTHQSFKQRVDMLESFWESEAPRIGEEGALGWSNSLLRENADVSDEQSETDDVDFQDIFEWAKAEINHEHVHWIPSKSVADTSDPFRTVLFDDLRPLLFEIRTPSVKVSLIYHFISYLRIPINEGVSTNSWRFNDPFSRLPGWCSGADSAGILSRSQIKQFFGIDVPQNDRLGFGVRNVPGSLHIVQPEGNKSRWSILRREDVEAAEKSGAGKPEFAQRTILQCMPLQLDHTDMLSSTALFLESWTNIKGAKQLAKRLLKEQRMNLPLWNAYAQSELAKGNKDEARKVYMTALQSYPSFPPDNRVHAALLHRMFAQLEIDSGMVNRALCVLLSLSSPGLIASIGDGSSDSEPPVATSIVKGRKLLSQRLEAFFSGQKPFINVTPQSQAFIDTLYCHATVDLLTTTLDTAAAHYERALKSPILPCGAVRECVWHDYASLMFQHRERGVGGSGFRPALTREIIERAMAEEAGCWNNAVLWEMYGANEGQAKLENRLRRYLGQILDVHSTQMLWTFAVWSEVHHHSTANVNFIRSLFENALDGSGPMVNSLSLWCLRILFEFNHNNAKKAKDLFYRAIQRCPWAKGLYMLPFTRMRSEFTTNELWDIVSVMEEKEIRLRISLPVEVQEE